MLSISALYQLLAVGSSCGSVRFSSPAFVVPLLIGTVCSGVSSRSSSSLSTGIVVLSLSTGVVVLSLSTGVVGLSLSASVGCGLVLLCLPAVRLSLGFSSPAFVMPLLVRSLCLPSAVRSSSGCCLASPAFVVPLLVSTVRGTSSSGSLIGSSSVVGSLLGFPFVVPLLVRCLCLSSAVRGSSGPSSRSVAAPSLMAKKNVSMMVVY
jgi:hypothetical protein